MRPTPLQLTDLASVEWAKQNRRFLKKSPEPAVSSFPPAPVCCRQGQGLRSMGIHSLAKHINRPEGFVLLHKIPMIPAVAGASIGKVSAGLMD